MGDDFFLKKKRPSKRDQDDFNVDDMDLEGSGGELDSENSEAEMERRETAAQKRLRLAKRYLSKVQEEVGDEGDIDAAQIDRDLISERLQVDVLEAAGKAFFQIAHLFANSSFTTRVLKGGNKGHELSVTCIAVSQPSQKILKNAGIENSPIYVYSCSKDASIIKWDFETGQRLEIIAGGLKHTRKTVATIGKKNLLQHVGHSKAIYSLDVSSDGQWLATGGHGKVIHVWNALTMEHIGKFNQHKDSISGLKFRKGQNQLYSSSFDRSVKLWNIDEMAYIETLFGHQDQIGAIDTLTRERCLTSGSRDRTVRLWKIPEESQLIFRGQLNSEDESKLVGGSVDVVAMIDEELFVSGGDCGSISLWSVTRKKPVFTEYKCHDTSDPNVCGWIVSLAAVPYTDLFASGSGDGAIKLWKINDSKTSFSMVATIPVAGIINSMQFVELNVKKAQVYSRPTSIVSRLTGIGKNVLAKRSSLHLVVAVGQEHRFGRWFKSKAKNSVQIIDL